MRLPIILFLTLATTLATAQEHHRVHRVVDGDTVVLNNDERVRLRGVNTPETGEAAAEAATDFARSFCEGEDAVIDLGKAPDGKALPPERDGYGRLLGDVVVDGRSLMEELVREGHAHAFFIPPTRLQGEERLVALQVEARRHKRGIWSTPRFQGTLHITSFHANAPGDDRENLNGEYLRIANIGTRPVDLAGYTLQNHRGMRLTFPAATLPVGHTVMVLSGRGTNSLDPSLGPVRFYWQLDDAIWGNRGDTATLRSPRGRVEDEVEYKPKKWWGSGRRSR